jgi:hypothetical protein
MKTKNTIVGQSLEWCFTTNNNIYIMICVILVILLTL